MSRLPGIFILGILLVMVIGCGGNSSSTAEGTPVTITFVGTAPQALAVQTGNGPFTAASLEAGNFLHLVVPTGATKYAIAYVCALTSEFVFEATITDSTEVTAKCPLSFDFSSSGLVTGSVNASGIAGAKDLFVVGPGIGTNINGISGPFSLLLPAGGDDVAFVASDSLGSALGVKILPAQNVPGAVNNGNTVVLGPGDATITRPATILNVSSGFSLPALQAQYHTVNGTAISLTGAILGLSNPAPTYPAVPAASIQSGDFYQYSVRSFDLATFNEQIGTSQTTTQGGGPVTLALPAPWSFAGPTPAAFPTFTFNYAGFSGLPAVSQQATLTWFTTPKSFFSSITVSATANFQNGATTLTIPDLTSLVGFLSPASSGTTVSWTADIFGGTTQQFIFSVNPPPNGSVSFAQNRGDYVEP